MKNPLRLPLAAFIAAVSLGLADPTKADTDITSPYTTSINGSMITDDIWNVYNNGEEEDINGSITSDNNGGVSNGTQNFFDSAYLNATASGAVSGGTQNFFGSSVLNASSSQAITGGTQNFSNTAYLNALNSDAVAGGTQSFFDISALSVQAGNGVSGGIQNFSDNAILYATTTNAITGGTQNFSGQSSLNLGDEDTPFAVSGGTQIFDQTSQMNASTTNGVSGGTQTFLSTATLYASVQGAVVGGTITLKDNSSIQLLADNALGSGTTITFDATNGGAGGMLVLQGHSATIGRISSLEDDSLVVRGTILNSDTSAAAATLTVDFDTEASTFAGLIEDGAGGGSLSLVKEGTGTLELSGTITVIDNVTTINGGTYTGTTTINGGTLNVTGSIASSDVTINATGTLSGDGTVGALTVAAGGTLSPGNLGIGTLTSGNQTWGGDGILEFEINSATGIAGTNWDSLTIDGALGITADNLQPFVFKITTLDGAAPGPMANFTSGMSYSWLVASTTDGISGLDMDNVIFDTSDFANGTAPAFQLSVIGNDLYLSATPVPEPAEWGTAFGVGLFLLLIVRRCVKTRAAGV